MVNLSGIFAIAAVPTAVCYLYESESIVRTWRTPWPEIVRREHGTELLFELVSDCCFSASLLAQFFVFCSRFFSISYRLPSNGLNWRWLYYWRWRRKKKSFLLTRIIALCHIDWSVIHCGGNQTSASLSHLSSITLTPSNSYVHHAHPVRFFESKNRPSSTDNEQKQIGKCIHLTCKIQKLYSALWKRSKKMSRETNFQ